MPKYLDSKTVLIYCPHPVYTDLLTSSFVSITAFTYFLIYVNGNCSIQLSWGGSLKEIELSRLSLAKLCTQPANSQLIPQSWLNFLTKTPASVSYKVPMARCSSVPSRIVCLTIPWARIWKPFQGAQESIPSQAGRCDNPIWRTGPPGNVGWRIWFLGIDSWTP